MSWTTYLTAAILEAHPEAQPGFEFTWSMTDTGPEMLGWDEDFFGGPFALEDWEERCRVTAKAQAVALIRGEAERRIAVGLITNGKAFKTDDSTTQTLSELVQGFLDGDVPAGGFTFSTAAGDAVAYETSAEADFIRRVANAYRAQVKAASHTLQSMDQPPADYANDIYWPNYVDVIPT